MKTLVLMRHAKSSWGSLDLADRDRPLNSRGKAAAPLMGAWIKAQGYVPQTALVSTATRTRQTWDLLDLDVKPVFLPKLYLAEPSEILAEAAKTKASTLMVLGHNPGIGELAAELASQWPAHDKFMQFPTAAICVLGFDLDDWSELGDSTGIVEAFITPSDL